MPSNSQLPRPWIGEILFRTRKAAGLPSRAMADLLGMAHSTYYKIETGARTAPDEAALQMRAAKVAGDLKVDFATILEEIRTKRAHSFYTPREVIEIIVSQIGDTDGSPAMVDPAAGSGGFLLTARQALESIASKTSDQLPLLPVRRLSYNSFEWIDDPSLITFRRRPKALEGRPLCYAIKVVTDSMAPRYEINDLIIVQPDEPVNPGDDCILSRPFGDQTISNIIRLHAATSKHIQARQFSARPEMFIVPIQRAILHRIVPLDELL